MEFRSAFGAGVADYPNWSRHGKLEQAWQITQTQECVWSRRGVAGVASQAWQKKQSEGLLFHKIKERKHEADRSCERLGWELA